MATQAAPHVPACPRCGAPAVWHAQVGQWGCDHCRQMLPPPSQPAAYQPAGYQPPTMAPPLCPQCHGPGAWQPQAGQWGCDRCRMYIAPPVGHAPPGSNLALRILAVIVVIAIGVIVKLAIRGAFR